MRNRRVLLASHRGRRDLLAGASRKPTGPIRPPAALVFRGALHPLLWAARIRIVNFSGPVRALAARRVDDSRDMAAGGQHEPHLAAKQLCDPPRRVPRHDVVLLRPDRIGLEGNTAEVDWDTLERNVAG